MTAAVVVAVYVAALAYVAVVAYAVHAVAVGVGNAVAYVAVDAYYRVVAIALAMVAAAVDIPKQHTGCSRDRLGRHRSVLLCTVDKLLVVVVVGNMLEVDTARIDVEVVLHLVMSEVVLMHWL